MNRTFYTFALIFSLTLPSLFAGKEEVAKWLKEIALESRKVNNLVSVEAKLYTAGEALVEKWTSALVELLVRNGQLLSKTYEKHGPLTRTQKTILREYRTQHLGIDNAIEGRLLRLSPGHKALLFSLLQKGTPSTNNKPFKEFITQSIAEIRSHHLALIAQQEFLIEEIEKEAQKKAAELTEAKKNEEAKEVITQSKELVAQLTEKIKEIDDKYTPIANLRAQPLSKILDMTRIVEPPAQPKPATQPKPPTAAQPKKVVTPASYKPLVTIPLDEKKMDYLHKRAKELSQKDIIALKDEDLIPLIFETTELIFDAWQLEELARAQAEDIAPFEGLNTSLNHLRQKVADAASKKAGEIGKAFLAQKDSFIGQLQKPAPDYHKLFDSFRLFTPALKTIMSAEDFAALEEQVSANDKIVASTEERTREAVSRLQQRMTVSFEPLLKKEAKFATVEEWIRLAKQYEADFADLKELPDEAMLPWQKELKEKLLQKATAELTLLQRKLDSNYTAKDLFETEYKERTKKSFALPFTLPPLEKKPVESKKQVQTKKPEEKLKPEEKPKKEEKKSEGSKPATPAMTSPIKKEYLMVLAGIVAAAGVAAHRTGVLAEVRNMLRYDLLKRYEKLTKEKIDLLAERLNRLRRHLPYDDYLEKEQQVLRPYSPEDQEKILIAMMRMRIKKKNPQQNELAVGDGG